VLYRLFYFSLGLVSPSDISELAFCFEAWFALVIAPRARVKMIWKDSAEAANRVAIGWGVDLRIFLGDVELLFVAEVDLSHAGSTVFARIRDAATWLWRVRAVCAGVVCIEKSFVARGA
jgi:hypothetical protein